MAAARPCRFCGDEVTSTDPAVDFCRGCHYGCRADNEMFAPLIARLVAAAPCGATVGCEHTGGGCKWLAVRLPSGAYVAGTAAFQEDGEGEWTGDAVLPDPLKDERWCLYFYKDDEDEGAAGPIGVDADGFVAYVAERSK